MSLNCNNKNIIIMNRRNNFNVLFEAKYSQLKNNYKYYYKNYYYYYNYFYKKYNNNK